MKIQLQLLKQAIQENNVSALRFLLKNPQFFSDDVNSLDEQSLGVFDFVYQRPLKRTTLAAKLEIIGLLIHAGGLIMGCTIQRCLFEARQVYIQMTREYDESKKEEFECLNLILERLFVCGNYQIFIDSILKDKRDIVWASLSRNLVVRFGEETLNACKIQNVSHATEDTKKHKKEDKKTHIDEIVVNCQINPDYDPSHGYYGLAVLIAASLNSRMLEFLGHRGLNFKVKDVQGNTVFHAAAQTGCVKNLQYLMGCSDVKDLWNARNILGQTPFDLAVQGNHNEAIRLLAGFYVDHKQSLIFSDRSPPSPWPPMQPLTVKRHKANRVK